MQDHLHIDFETRSVADLRVVGLDNYAKDPSTQIWCMAFAFNDEEVEISSFGQEVPDRVLDHVAEGGIVISHNFQFEWYLWNRFFITPLAFRQGICTMAMSYAMGLPGSLEKAAAAMGIQKQKDMAGQRLMLQMCKPRDIVNGKPTWWDEPEKIKRLEDYCKNDVEVERELYKRLLHLSEKEKRVWQLDFEINQRGIEIDIPAVKKAITLVEKEKEKLDNEMRLISDGEIQTCTAVTQIKRYLEKEGILVDGLGKEKVIDLFKEDNSPTVKRILELRQQGSKTSTAKLQGMVDRASPDHRIRNTLQYHGANTGRWAARGIQIHNFPRGNFSESDTSDIVKAIEAGRSDYIELLYGPVLLAISDCLRSFITAKSGHQLIWADFDQIEARIVAWLASEKSVLDIFRRGGKLYEEEAARIYRCKLEDVDAERRRIGKTATLALGFGGGVQAFQAMAKNLGFKISDAEAERIKVAWREAHPKTCQFWRRLEHLAMSAVRNPGNKFAFDEKISYLKKGSFLFCQLPSGRVLTYPYPKIEQKETPWKELRESLTYMTENGTTRKWERTHTYGGSLCENVTQAVARDLLVEAMVGLYNDGNGLDIVFHVHDEIVCEVPETSNNLDKVIRHIVTCVPDWALGLPIGATVSSGKRYRK